MKSGFITPTDKIELAPHELLAFAHDYCKSHEAEGFRNFSQQYAFVDSQEKMDLAEIVNPAYEYVLKELKWIQVGTLVAHEDAYVTFSASDNTLEVCELNSDNYEELTSRKGKFITRITCLNNFWFLANKKEFSLKNGFVLQDGTLIGYNLCCHAQIAKALVNYLGTNNEAINFYFKIFDESCYEDLFVRLLGFVKAGNYGPNKVIMYTPELASPAQQKMVDVYKMLGFRVDELPPFDLDSSKQMIKTLKF